MAVKFSSKQSQETKLPQFYRVSLLNWLLIVIVIVTVVVKDFSMFSEQKIQTL